MAGIGAVERAENIHRLHANLVRVNHPSPAVGIEGLLGNIIGEAAALVEKVKPAPAHFQVQLAADAQHTIANGLGLQSARWETPEQARLGIHAQCLFAWMARLPIDARGDDEPVQFFQRPALPDELQRQPVEQLGVRGRSTHFAKVRRRVHETVAKMVLPYSIDQHARGQRMAWLREVLGQG